MNKELREKHLAEIGDETITKLYDVLCDSCAKRPEGLSDADQMLIGDYCRLEKMKKALSDDIKKRGIVVDFYNGRQHMTTENKSVGACRQVMDQQRKELAELKLTPVSRKAAPATLDDEFESF